jgi:hypothetical protein
MYSHEILPVASATSPVNSEAAQRLLDSLVAGYRHRTIRDIDLILGLKKLQTMGLNQREMAQAFARSDAWLSMRLGVMKLEAEVLEQMYQGRLSWSNALVLTELVGQPALQVELAREICRRDLSQRQARLLIRQRADQAHLLLASDERALEKEFKKLYEGARLAAELIGLTPETSDFRFEAMLMAYPKEDVARLKKHLAGCACFYGKLADACRHYLEKS